MSMQKAPPARIRRRRCAPTGAWSRCVGGRGRFDDVVSTMLVQLLGRQGVACRAVAHTLVSREAIAQLDLSDVTVVNVSCLELAGTPAHLRDPMETASATRVRRHVHRRTLAPG